jgi:hypothetical protein
MSNKGEREGERLLMNKLINVCLNLGLVKRVDVSGLGWSDWPANSFKPTQTQHN